MKHELLNCSRQINSRCASAPELYLGVWCGLLTGIDDGLSSYLSLMLHDRIWRMGEWRSLRPWGFRVTAAPSTLEGTRLCISVRIFPVESRISQYWVLTTW